MFGVVVTPIAVGIVCVELPVQILTAIVALNLVF